MELVRLRLITHTYSGASSEKSRLAAFKVDVLQMLRVAAGVRAPLRFAQVRCYSEGGFEISDYLSRIEAITKSRKPQSRGPTHGRKLGGQAQNKPQNQYQRTRGQRASAKPGQNVQAQADAGAKAGGGQRGPRKDGKPTGQFNRKPRTQPPGPHGAPRDAALQATATQAGAIDTSRKPTTVSVAGFTPLSSISQKPLPKGGRRAAGASRAPRARAKGAKKPQASQRTNKAALMARNALQGTEQDTSFLHARDGLEILMRNQNSTVNGFISVDDVSLQALQSDMVSSAVSYNSRVRSLLRDLPENVLSDRERLNALVRTHVQGLYDEGVVVEAKNGSVSSEALVKVLNANPTYSGENKQLLAGIGNGKVSIKQIARSA